LKILQVTVRKSCWI